MADKLQGSVIPVETGFLNYAARADRSRRPDRAVEFSADVHELEDGPGARGRQHGVLKPSEITPSTLRIVELMAEVGFPAGVVNIVPGYAAGRLAEHPGVGKIAFTGSTATGRRIVEASQGNLKRVQLELGGKGANIVFDDADLDAAINGAPRGRSSTTRGRRASPARVSCCTNASPMLLERFVALASSIRIGNPLDANTEMGPLTSKQHLDRVLAFVDVARAGRPRPYRRQRAAGPRARQRLLRAPDGHRGEKRDRSYRTGGSVRPVRHGAALRQRRRSAGYCERNRIRAGQRFSGRRISRAHKMASQINAGMCWINCYKRVNPGSLFGGVGQSGYGREMGFEAMHDYTEARSVGQRRRQRAAALQALRFAMDRFVYQGTPSRVVFRMGRARQAAGRAVDARRPPRVDPVHA